MNQLVKQEGATALTPAQEEANLIKVLGDSLYPGATTASIKMVVDYCKQARLNPMLKPVHIVPMSVKQKGSDGKDSYVWRDVIMPGVAHYRTQASRTGQYIGKTEPEFGPDVERKVGGVDMVFPAWCRVTVRRLVGDREAEFTAKELWLENYATKGKDSAAPNAMWAKRPYGQLAKVAEAQALRMAFPELLGGANTAEEMEGKSIDGMRDVTPEPDEAKAPEAGRKAARRADSTANQLDGFAAKPKASQPVDAGPETVDVDPETGEVLPSLPNMPAEASADWNERGRWMPGWKWLRNVMPELAPPARQALFERYWKLFEKARSYNDQYAETVNGFLNEMGVKFNAGN